LTYTANNLQPAKF